MSEYTLPIETYYNNNYPLNDLSNFYYKFIQEHNEKTYNYYVINYNRSKRAEEVQYTFCENLEQNTTNPWGDYNCTGTQYQCTFKVYEENQSGLYEPITPEQFNYTNALNNCVETNGLAIHPTYSGNSTTYIASNLWSENYLDTTKWKTQEVEPSPSPEPEEPSGDTTGNTTFLILISAILMLIVMYRFIGSLFSRGD